MTWPNLSAQAGEGRQSEAAAASENSALVRLVSGPGRACSQAADSLPLWSQDHTGRLVRSCLGCISNPFLTNFAQVTSRSSATFPLVLPSRDTPPTSPTRWPRFSCMSISSQEAAWRSSSYRFLQRRLNSLPSLQSDASITLHLSPVASSPKHSSPPKMLDSW